MSTWALGDDLGRRGTVALVVVLLLGVILLLVELRRQVRWAAWVALTGVLGLAAFAGAVLRPVRVASHGSLVGPRVLVFVDGSRRLELPGDGTTTRRARALEALRALEQHFGDARLQAYEFSDGALRAVVRKPEASGTTSDLEVALGAALAQGERPDAVVVLSDGRLGGAADGSPGDPLAVLAAPSMPVHTVSLAERGPKDASIRALGTAGAAVAHQPFGLRVEVGCSGGLECKDVPVTLRELLADAPPAVLASGVVRVEDGVGVVELPVTLERPGTRIVEISIAAPAGDAVPENDVRLVPFTVARERLRLLHVAGRPTYDVRALRTWLKSDHSVDLIAFFILRTKEDDTNTEDDAELALIPFPVNELFTQHLPSFDAVILQDIHAVEYQLARHLPALASYVEGGGGLIMVGGPSAFAGGGYDGTAVERVLPVSLPSAGVPYATDEVVPRVTAEGAVSPLLEGLGAALPTLPPLPGYDRLGPARPGAAVLWEHPTERAGSAPMPLLALGEAGDGRSIALALDSTHLFAFSEAAADSSGRGYGALWDGLLGWLMRDPRFEVARVDLPQECIAGRPAALRVSRAAGAPVEVRAVVTPLGQGASPIAEVAGRLEASGQASLALPPLPTGAYVARVTLGAGGPATRFDFACERGGAAWSDSRPDAERLVRIARATGGTSVTARDLSPLPVPRATLVTAERHVTAVLPPWVWTLAGALALGAHWLIRRRAGLP